MNRAARRASRRRIGGLAGMSLVATTGLLGAYLGNPRIPRAYAALTTDCEVNSSIDTAANTPVTSSLSLRQALEAHQGSTNCSTINFNPSVTTIPISTNLPTLTNVSSLTITGPGALTVNLSGKSGIRMNNPATGETLSISGLTFNGGNSGGNKGGAVYARNTNVVITDVTFTSNTSGGGGAAYVRDGSLDITGSTFTGNSAPDNYHSGGAVTVVFGNVNVSSSTFTGNTAGNNGGAIFVAQGDVTLTDSRFTGNQTTYLNWAQGGAVSGTHLITANSSTFSGNTSAYQTGAISGLNVTLTNSTITGNSSITGGAVSAGQNATASFTTFSGNSNTSGSPMSIDAASYTVSNSIFNETGTALSAYTASTATFSFFKSSDALVNNTAPSLIFADTAGVAPLNLGALANNGGTTLTMLPGAGSPVIGAADPDSTTPTVDQRGVTRTSPSTMGAVHVAFVAPETPSSGGSDSSSGSGGGSTEAATTTTTTTTTTATPTVAAVVVPVDIPTVTPPVSAASIVLANAGVSVLSGPARANAQVVEVNAPVSTSVANAPEVSVPAGSAVQAAATPALRSGPAT